MAPSVASVSSDPFERAISAIAVQQDHQWTQFRVMQTNDERLIKLTAWLDSIGGDCLILADCVPRKRADNEAELRYALANLAGFVLHWLVFGHSDLPSVTEAILAERKRQKKLFLDGKHQFDCASPIVDHRRKFRVLLEEVGEVAQQVDRLEAMPTHEHAQRDLRAELVQVAAVAIAWLESLETSVPSS